jgi:hypothetical protein
VWGIVRIKTECRDKSSKFQSVFGTEKRKMRETTDFKREDAKGEDTKREKPLPVMSTTSSLPLNAVSRYKIILAAMPPSVPEAREKCGVTFEENHQTMTRLPHAWELGNRQMPARRQSSAHQLGSKSGAWD